MVNGYSTGRYKQTARTFSFLNIVPSFSLVIRRRYPGYIQHLHNPIQHPVYNFEPSGLVAPNGSCVADVLGLSFERRVFEDHIGGLEDFDWQ